MRLVKTHTFNGVKYYIDVEADYDGYCENPDTSKDKEHPAIRIVNGLPCGNDKGAKSGLRFIAHEALHASKYSTHEDVVIRASTELSNLLWRLGYRRNPPL